MIILGEYEEDTRTQDTLDKLQLYLQQKSAKVTDLKPEDVVHNDEVPVVEEKPKEEFQETEDKTTNEDPNVEYIGATHDKSSKETIMSPEECSIAVQVYVQPPNTVLAPVQSKNKTLFANTLVQESMKIPDIVAPVCHQPFDDIPFPVLSDIQTISTAIPVPELGDDS